MELAREEELWLVKLQGDAEQLQEGISELKKSMKCIQQKLDKLGNSLLLEVRLSGALCVVRGIKLWLLRLLLEFALPILGTFLTLS